MIITKDILDELMLVWLLLVSLPIHAQQKHDDTVDDVLQYVPYATVLALKVCGVESRDEWKPLLITTAASWIVTGGAGYILKHAVREERPDGTDMKSFPSGHAMFAFAGATMLHHEYRQVSPWISVAGYGVATFTAIDRVVKERHHWYDAVCGAGIGILTAEATWWLSRKVFKKNENLSIGFTGDRLHIAYRF